SSGAKLLQRAFDRRPIYRPRVIIIDTRPARRRKMRTVAIKIIQRNPRSLLAEGALKPLGKPGLSRAAAADDCDQARSHWVTLRARQAAGRRSAARSSAPTRKCKYQS